MILTTITGAAIGLGIGAIAGEGMTVKRKETGKVKVDICVKKGWKSAWDKGIVPTAGVVATIGLLSILGAEAIKSQNEKEDILRDELWDRTESIVDEAIENESEERINRYCELSDMVSNFSGDLTKVNVISVDESKDKRHQINTFEAIGLKNMDKDTICDIVCSDIKTERIKMENALGDIVSDGSYDELRFLATRYDMFEETKNIDCLDANEIMEAIDRNREVNAAYNRGYNSASRMYSPILYI